MKAGKKLPWFLWITRGMGTRSGMGLIPSGFYPIARQGLRRIIKIGLIFAFSTSGCNSVFYQPDFIDYHSPANESLAYSNLSIPTEDGLLLHGWHIKPGDRSKGIVIHFHGNAQNMSSHAAYVTWLAHQGYNVLTFDYRGYGKSPGEASREGLIRDGTAVLRFVDQHPAFTQQDVFVLAQSIGGAVAIPSLALLQPRRLRGLVIESSFGSYRDMASIRLDKSWLTRFLQWPLSYLVSDDWRPCDFIDRLKVPLLFIHGDRDEVVPYGEGQRLFALAQSVDKHFWTIPDGGHIVAFGADESPYRKRLLHFLERYRSQARDRKTPLPGVDIQGQEPGLSLSRL